MVFEQACAVARVQQMQLCRRGAAERTALVAIHAGYSSGRRPQTSRTLRGCCARDGRTKPGTTSTINAGEEALPQEPSEALD